MSLLREYGTANCSVTLSVSTDERETDRGPTRPATNRCPDPMAGGIETEDQRRLLVENGCELGQGFLFSRPVFLDQIERMYKSTRPSPGSSPRSRHVPARSVPQVMGSGA